MRNNLSGLIQFAADDTRQATYSGHVYRKQIAKYGEWVNPQYPYLSSDPIMTLDEQWGETIVANFNNNVLGAPVPVPLNHTNDVKENTGRVLSLESVSGDGLYANLRIDDEDTALKLDKGIIFDCSISFDWNYVRTNDNKNYGPTLLHVALVNNPYLIEMNSFEKLDMALSQLEESFEPIGLSYAGRDVILLSRDKMKELSVMETATEETETEEATEEATEAETEETTEAETEEETPEGETAEETAEVADPQTELSRLRLENAELQLSREYDQLLAEGKVIPAQKDKILSLAKLSQGVELSTDAGKKTDVTSLVLDILRSGTQQFSTEESGSSKEEETGTVATDQTDEGKKPSETLSEDELAGFKAVGADPAKMDELAEKDPVYREALASLSK